MTCLRDIKYLTKKKVMALQPIYLVQAPLHIYDRITKPSIIKLEGEKLEHSIDNYLLYDSHCCFTSLEEAYEYCKERFNQDPII